MADEEWIERLARSLCREAGFNPGSAAEASGAVAEAAELDPPSDAEATVITPVWTDYVARAQAHVMAARALKLI